VIFEALTDPNRDPARAWLLLLEDEKPPRVVEVNEAIVVWSSLWTKRPDARIRFELVAEDQGTGLGLTLLVDEPLPEPDLLRHMARALNELIDTNLRCTFGQGPGAQRPTMCCGSPPRSPEQRELQRKVSQQVLIRRGERQPAGAFENVFDVVPI